MVLDSRRSLERRPRIAGKARIHNWRLIRSTNAEPRERSAGGHHTNQIDSEARPPTVESSWIYVCSGLASAGASGSTQYRTIALNLGACATLSSSDFDPPAQKDVDVLPPGPS